LTAMRDNLLTVGPDPVIRQKVAKRTWRGRDDWATAIAGGGEEIVGENRNEALAKQPPHAAASYHHEKNRQRKCSWKRCNYCCERKVVHNAISKGEKHAFPLDGKSPSHSLAGASWQSGVRS